MKRSWYKDLKIRNTESISQPDSNRWVVFLDIDGVLQPCGWEKRFDFDLDALKKEMSEVYQDPHYLKMDKHDLGAVFYDWDHISVGFLKQLLIENNAEIVLHSSWIHGNTLRNLKCLFRIHGLHEYVTDRVSDYGGFCLEKKRFDRPDAIEEYLDQHPEISNYVILDDINYEERLGEQFVLIHNRITEKTFQKACAALRNCKKRNCFV